MQAQLTRPDPAPIDEEDDTPPDAEGLRRRRLLRFSGNRASEVGVAEPESGDVSPRDGQKATETMKVETGNAVEATEGSPVTPRRSSRLNKVEVEDEQMPDLDSCGSEVTDTEDDDEVADEDNTEEPELETASEPIPEPATIPGALPPEPKAPTPEDPDSEKLCRICFGGTAEEPENGRLFSPCKCKGSMRYVHIGCLNEWRKQAAKQESFYRCDQCHYKYSFRRTWWAGMVMNEVVLTFLTLILFAILVFIAGFLSKLLVFIYLYFQPLDYLDSEPAPQPEEEADYWTLLTRGLDPRTVSLWRLDLSHMLAGFSLVGILGAFNVIFQIFISPFAPIPRFGLGGMVRVRGQGGNNESSFSSLVMVVLVVIGAARTGWAIYKTVKAFSRRSLEIVETSILDVRA